jgi:hypothetical protein
MVTVGQDMIEIISKEVKDWDQILIGNDRMAISIASSFNIKDWATLVGYT